MSVGKAIRIIRGQVKSIAIGRISRLAVVRLFLGTWSDSCLRHRGSKHINTIISAVSSEIRISVTR